MRFDGNYGKAVNYEPNSFGGPVEEPSVKEPALKISGDANRYDHRVGNEDYTQPGNLFRLMSPAQKSQLIGNLVNAMKTVPKEIQERQVAHFYKADPAYGEGVAKGMGYRYRRPKVSLMPTGSVPSKRMQRSRPGAMFRSVENEPVTFKRKKIAQFEELCRRQRLPKTIQRRVILEAVLDRQDHPTADQLLEDVRTRIAGVSRTTVYRGLEALVRLGMVRRAMHSDAVARFDGNTDHHHHLVCLGCARVTDLNGLKLDPIKLPDARRKGFEIADFSIHFEGYCLECRRRKTRALAPRPRPRREK